MASHLGQMDGTKTDSGDQLLARGELSIQSQSSSSKALRLNLPCHHPVLQLVSPCRPSRLWCPSQCAVLNGLLDMVPGRSIHSIMKPSVMLNNEWQGQSSPQGEKEGERRPWEERENLQTVDQELHTREDFTDSGAGEIAECNKNPDIQETRELVYICGPESFWHQKLVLWKTVFPGTREGTIIPGWFKHIAFIALFITVFLLHCNVPQNN